MWNSTGPKKGRRLRWGLLTATWLALTACNSLTGVDDIYLTDDEQDDDDGSSSAAVTSGQGGANAVAAGPTNTVAAGTTAGAGGMSTSSNAASNTVAASSSSSGSGPCMYPPGPYGVAQGDIVPPSLSWQGYAPGGNSPTTLTMQDLFDCDGSKGIHAILFDTSQYG